MRLFLLGFVGFVVALAVSVSPSLLMRSSFSASLPTRFFGARHHNGTRAARAGALPGGRAQASAGGQAGGMDSKLPAGKDPREVTEGEWKTILSPEQFRVLRQKGKGRGAGAEGGAGGGGDDDDDARGRAGIH